MSKVKKIEIVTDFNDSKYFINREISLLEFNKRVLLEAESKEHPLLERLKFLTIFSSNLDEFYMIRVAGLKGQIQEGVADLSIDGFTPQEQLKQIRSFLQPLYLKQETILKEDILPNLEKEGIYIHHIDTVTEEEKCELNSYFCKNVLPVLTPHSSDPAHPFPKIINRSLNIAFVLNDYQKKFPEKRVAILQLPPILPRFVELHREDGYHFVLLEEVVKSFASILFPGLEIDQISTFRITRDADIEIAEDEAEDLMVEISEQIKQRRMGTAVVRLEVDSQMPRSLNNFLAKSLEIDSNDIYVLNRPLNLPDFMQLLKIDIRHLKDLPFKTRVLNDFKVEGPALFDAMRKKDHIIHLPFDSFTNSVLKLINTAADDPAVLAIKMTLYRVGMNSPIVAALIRAAENGKEVTAFVELKARFDEANNIIWARELENVGVHVVYGVLGLKTHCKIAMIVRKEGNSLKTYTHLSTGNYNHQTARIYTDCGIFTANEDIASDAIHLFNYLTGYSYHKDWKHLVVAPLYLRKKLIAMIERETELHTPENPGFIFVKLNAIAHDEVSKALYSASQKGVKIQILCRGMCCLRPGIKGVSDNIEVRSIIGRFLEHSRIFYFRNGGNEEFYLSSADWMTRNLHHRVEVMFPVLEHNLQKHLSEILEIYWSDNQKAWRLNSDGSYSKVLPEADAVEFSAQRYFLDELNKSKKKFKSRTSPFLKR